MIGLEPSLSRAQEYTADRCAARYVPEGARGLVVVYAGKRVYRHVDVDAYRRSVANHRDGLWLRLANLFSSHAVGFRRLQALSAVDQEGWDVHGRML
ncbi:M48 family metalloprotease [Euzebya sp.]|uniref:M48 family metalloprotease n=1 Tax=Euzebya sp. TaxID=1971409 RepID=UPI003514153A